MTVDDVKAALEEMRRLADDDEAAHSREDCLHQMVLQAIADGAPNAADLAKAALGSVNIEFSRWCA